MGVSHSLSLQRSAEDKEEIGQWKFLEQMEFLIAIKGTRTVSGNLPEASDEETETAADILQAAVEEADIEVETDGVNVFEQPIAVAVKRKESAQGGPKHKKKRNVQESEDPILSLIKQKLERKPESSRMGFFKSIMPRVEALEEDLFQEFQLQTLQSLKKLHALQTQQGHSSWQSGQSSLSSHTIFTPIPSPLSSATTSPPPVSSAMTSPSPSSSCYPRTTFHHSQGQTP